jgi:poly(3-hydroxyoctanoate) depolymerase
LASRYRPKVPRPGGAGSTHHTRADRLWGAERLLVVDGQPLRIVRGGVGSPLLLLNGIGASAEMWAPIAPMLEARDVIAVDLPGVGSSPPTPHPMRMRALTHLLVHLLDALGIQRLDVLGYSFGGIVAQELARRAHGVFGALSSVPFRQDGQAFRPSPWRRC